MPFPVYEIIILFSFSYKELPLFFETNPLGHHGHPHRPRQSQPMWSGQVASPILPHFSFKVTMQCSCCSFSNELLENGFVEDYEGIQECCNHFKTMRKQFFFQNCSWKSLSKLIFPKTSKLGEFLEAGVVKVYEGVLEHWPLWNYIKTKTVSHSKLYMQNAYEVDTH